MMKLTHLHNIDERFGLTVGDSKYDQWGCRWRRDIRLGLYSNPSPSLVKYMEGELKIKNIEIKKIFIGSKDCIGYCEIEFKTTDDKLLYQLTYE